MAISPQVLFLGPADAVDTVRAELPGYGVVQAVDDAAVDAALDTCDVVLDAYMRIRFDAARIGRAARLKLIVTATTGADHIDGAALEARGIPLLTLRGERDFLRNITPAAEHSWLLLMACARGLRGAVAEVLEGGWDRNHHPGLMLRGRTLGLVGCGRIGGWMARYAAAFGMRCLGYDPFVEDEPEGIRLVDLNTVLAEADFVSIHVPLTDDTRHLIGPAELARMRTGAVLINTSRGDVVDEAALLAALKDGRLRAAGLDVLTAEPDIAHDPLVQYAAENTHVIITPHIGGFSPDALETVLRFSCERIRRHLADGTS